MHAAAANLRLVVASLAIRARLDVRLFGLGLGAATCLVQGGRGDEVLDDGAVASKLVRGGRGSLGGRFGNNSLEYGILVWLLAVF